MKLISLIITTCIFFGLSLNSLIVLHFEYNYEYIVTEVCVEKDVKDSCCKGSCHLTDEFSKTDNTSNSDEPSTVPTLEVLNWFQSESSPAENNSKLELESQEISADFATRKGISTAIEHPPRA